MGGARTWTYADWQRQLAGLLRARNLSVAQIDEPSMRKAYFAGVSPQAFVNSPLPLAQPTGYGQSRTAATPTRDLSAWRFLARVLGPWVRANKAITACIFVMLFGWAAFAAYCTWEKQHGLYEGSRFVGRWASPFETVELFPDGEASLDVGDGKGTGRWSISAPGESGFDIRVHIDRVSYAGRPEIASELVLCFELSDGKLRQTNGDAPIYLVRQ